MAALRRRECGRSAFGHRLARPGCPGLGGAGPIAPHRTGAGAPAPGVGGRGTGAGPASRPAPYQPSPVAGGHRFTAASMVSQRAGRACAQLARLPLTGAVCPVSVHGSREGVLCAPTAPYGSPAPNMTENPGQAEETEEKVSAAHQATRPRPRPGRARPGLRRSEPDGRPDSQPEGRLGVCTFGMAGLVLRWPKCPSQPRIVGIVLNRNVSGDGL